MDENSVLFSDISGKLPDHVKSVKSIADALMCFHEAREKTYNMSFARRGETGVWMNLGRKYDRIDVLANQVFEKVGAGEKPGNVGVTLVDTLADIIVYALKWIDVIRVTRPQDLDTWINQVFCKDTGIAPSEAYALFGLWQEEPEKIRSQFTKFVDALKHTTDLEHEE